jgi:hypothetical protein
VEETPPDKFRQVMETDFFGSGHGAAPNDCSALLKRYDTPFLAANPRPC